MTWVVTGVGTPTKDGQAEQGSEGGHGSGTDANSFLHYGPKPYLTCTEHELCLVIV